MCICVVTIHSNDQDLYDVLSRAVLFLFHKLAKGLICRKRPAKIRRFLGSPPFKAHCLKLHLEVCCFSKFIVYPLFAFVCNIVCILRDGGPMVESLGARRRGATCRSCCTSCGFVHHQEKNNRDFYIGDVIYPHRRADNSPM